MSQNRLAAEPGNAGVKLLISARRTALDRESAAAGYGGGDLRSGAVANGGEPREQGPENRDAIGAIVSGPEDLVDSFQPLRRQPL